MRDGPDGERTQLFLPGGGPEVDFLTMPLAMGGAPVTGAPYSADAVTEVVQTLADGNRIVRQSKTPLARDSRGRTRREQGLTQLGNMVGATLGVRPGPRAENQVTVQVHDPEAGVMFILDPQKKEARRLPAPKIAVTHIESGAGGDLPTAGDRVEVQRGPGGRTVRVVQRHIIETDTPASDSRTEPLGSRRFEGVEADGTRTTLTIPAGQIGNEQPIQVISERWYAPALQVLVYSRQSDPRFGETTYRLANLVRAEPPAELFQVPTDYTVVDPLKDLDIQMRQHLVTVPRVPRVPRAPRAGRPQ